jgi:membrane protease subunit HflK
MQSVFEKTNTILFDVKGGNNVIYLPIDNRQRAKAMEQPAKESENAPIAMEAPEEAVRNTRIGVEREREGRRQR